MYLVKVRSFELLLKLNTKVFHIFLGEKKVLQKACDFRFKIKTEQVILQSK